MKKVIVIGCPGAGKSTFSRKLRDTLHLPLYYLDQIWHKPDRTTVSQQEFDLRLQEILQKDCWILDGNYLRTLEPRLALCDTVFFLDYPLKDCLAGAESRIGKVREDLPWVETELDPEFKQWILDFPKDQRPKICELLHTYRQGREIVVFTSRQQAQEYWEHFPYQELASPSQKF